jgi:hypothetical protein
MVSLHSAQSEASACRAYPARAEAPEAESGCWTPRCATHAVGPYTIFRLGGGADEKERRGSLGLGAGGYSRTGQQVSVRTNDGNSGGL